MIGAAMQQAAACKRLLAAAAAGVRFPVNHHPQPQQPPQQTVAFNMPDGLAFAVQGMPGAGDMPALYQTTTIPITF